MNITRRLFLTGAVLVPVAGRLGSAQRMLAASDGWSQPKKLRLALMTARGEASFVGYARVPTTGEDWAVDGRAIVCKRRIDWPQCTGGSETITGIALMDERGGVVARAQLGYPVVVAIAITLSINPGQLTMVL